MMVIPMVLKVLWQPQNFARRGILMMVILKLLKDLWMLQNSAGRGILMMEILQNFAGRGTRMTDFLMTLLPLSTLESSLLQGAQGPCLGCHCIFLMQRLLPRSRSLHP